MMATTPRPITTTTYTLSSAPADRKAGRSKFIDNFDYDVVPLSKVIVDYSYARPLTKARMRRLEKMKYNPAKAGTLYMSLRDNGDYAVIDGQGRIYLAQQNDVSRVPARIYIDLTPEQEADLYLAFNRDRAATTALDDFLAEVVAGEPQALAIQEILNSLNIGVMRGGSKPNTVQGMAVIQKTYTEWGEYVLREALRLALDVWKGQPGSLTGAIMGGIVAFIVRYPTITAKQRDDLVYRLSGMEPKRLMGRARVKQEEVHGMAIDQAVGRVILATYNHGRRYDSPLILGEWIDRKATPAALAKKPEAARKAAATRKRKRDSETMAG